MEIWYILILAYCVVGSYLAGAINEQEENKDEKPIVKFGLYLLLMFFWWMFLLHAFKEWILKYVTKETKDY